MRKISEIFNKYGVGFVLVGATLDGYRRQVLSDNTKKQLDEIDRLKDQLDVRGEKGVY